MLIKLLVSDTEYLQAFAEMIMNAGTSVFAERVEEINSLEKEECLYLVDNQLQNSDMSDDSSRRIVQLTSNRADVNLDYKKGELKVFKYDSVSNILSQLLIIDSHVFNHDAGRRLAEGRIIAVCGTSDRETAFEDVSRFVARQLRYNGVDSILVISGRHLNPYCAENANECMERLLYNIQKPDYCRNEASFYEDQYGVSYIRSKALINRLTELEAEELHLLIRELLHYFDLLVYDFGACFTGANMSVAEISELVVFCAESGTELGSVLNDKIANKTLVVRQREGRESCEMYIADELSKRYGADVND